VWSRVEQLLVFNNKLQMSLRSLYSAQCERNSLKHKVLAVTMLLLLNNNNNINHDNVYGAIIMTRVIARVHAVRLMNVD